MKGRRPRYLGREPRKKDGEAGPRPASGSRRQVIAPGECYRQVGLSSRTIPKTQWLPREV